MDGKMTYYVYNVDMAMIVFTKFMPEINSIYLIKIVCIYDV